ncbi:SDR family oxidoreductase [Leptospira sp. GIMC2001]|uniref:SDR family oxidoreductase n=1 Tax=Leptospira sp. GIMC2001 TaxID=1513297 RepID=UPI00234B30D0|nr:SDR family oxidoreductase [Leptospira sp. GIMC2001]WCL49763.1 SDR family oxidoreductase [Leptospira sp. GIMC2001]
MRLKGKIALITGGNSGIGLETAKLFKKEGAQVIITARSQESFDKATSELGDQFDIVKTDVSNLKELDSLYKHIDTKYNKLDILFANAGVAYFKPTSDVDENFFDQQFDTNVKGLYFTVSKALPYFNQGSSVILNASVVANKGFPGSSVYVGTKAAVRSFARGWTSEIPVDQIRFNVLSPGAIDTPIYEKLGMPPENLKEFANNMIAGIPAKRFGTSAEMAKVALFLASEESSYIAGADIIADGGYGQI